MTYLTVTLAAKKAEELKEIFPDKKVPVSSLRVDYDPDTTKFYYHIDNSVLFYRQSTLLIEHLKKTGIAKPDESDHDILSRAVIFREDVVCPDCGTEGAHDCQADHVNYPEPAEDEMEMGPEGDDDFESDEDFEEGETGE